MNRKPLIEHLLLDVCSLPDGTSEIKVTLSITGTGKTKTSDPAELQALERKGRKGIIRFAMADVIDAVAELKEDLRKVGDGMAGGSIADHPTIKEILAKVDRTLEGER